MTARLALRCALVGGVATYGQYLSAQTIPRALGAAEIEVTAQRRLQPAQDVPISLTALPGEDLAQLQATDTPSLSRFVPSLLMMRTGAFTQPYIRGVGKRSTLGVENSVATYVDGVYLASPISALLDLGGVERVEVLNGPQGTLFGRNATGGVIQVITRDPEAGATAQATVSAATDGYFRSDIYLAGGDERLAANLAMSLSRDGGFGTNLFSGKTDVGRIDHNFAGRSKWVWRPQAQLKITLAGDYQDRAEDASTAPVPGYPPLGQPRILDFRDRDQDAPTYYRFRYGGGSLRADLGIGSTMLTSLSALRRMHAHYGVDLDSGPAALFSAVALADQDQFSQELQLQSGKSSKITWVAGLYYLHLDEEYGPTTFAYGGSYSARLGGRTGQTLFALGTASSYAAYGQAAVPIGDETLLTLGLRYTIERRTVRASGDQQFDNAPLVRPIAGLPLETQPPFRNALTFREPTWRLSLERHFSPEVMAYLSESRGFQSGGWNLQTPQNPPFRPERLDDFEAGVKYGDRGKHIQASANVFYYNYEDMQVSAITPIGNATVNAASANSYGMELQLDARPDSATDIALGAAWLKTSFNRFPNASCIDYSSSAPVPYAPMACDVSGNRLPFSPTLKFNVRASREISLGAAGTLLLSGNLSYNSGYYGEADNVVRQGAFATLDASAEWRPGPKAPSVRIWALNLTNARYFNNIVAFPTVGILQNPSAPARFGVSLSYSD